ncbi:paraquat-inducible protein A [Gilliamella bombicola]|uniref:Paraquat-inducible protein A n=1 Tax=Gilliamella bombicola TaxID=1798182 RepID=A0A1C4C6L3_9GAMM|nr:MULTISPECIES: PqiA/YebS family transporter subunit [Gilliamella]NUF28185.1 PqiA/YebS family transporter subunit [Gilliamella sp. ESL0254]SCC14695.1 paraquat-inducible protein A [Gilliamella bombicola]
MIIDRQHYVLCSHCDLVIELSDITVGHKAVCPRCNATLAKNNSNMKFSAVMYAICSLIMIIVACGFIFIDIRIVGNFIGVSVLDIPKTLFSDNYSYISALFILFVLLFPIFNLSIIVLLCSKLQLTKYRKRDLLVVYEKCQHWCMPEIFLTGILVSFVKLMSYGSIGVTGTFWAFCLFVFFYIKSLVIFSPETIWNEIHRSNFATDTPKVGKTGICQNLKLCKCCQAILPVHYVKCPRCKQKSNIRDRDKIQWTLALLVTSLILYIPANLFGIMITVVFGSSSTSTIMDGVIYMWQAGDIPVALVIFIASVVIPILKIISLSWLCYFALAVKRKNKQHCLRMKRLYTAVEFIGKWSMIDIFVVAVICSLVRNQQMMGVYPDIGVTFFATVVIITMIASQKFDPRLIWDRPKNRK